MSMLSNALKGIFGGGKNPADAAQPYLNQIPGVGHQYYDPYVSAGRDASSTTKSQYENLINDPQGFLDKIMQGYNPSSGFQFKKDQLQKALGGSAAAGGYAGTTGDQYMQGEGVDNLLSEDMQQYLQNVLGLYNTGLSGEEGIAGRGYNASSSLADLLGGGLNQQANLAFQGQQQQNTNKNALMNSLMKLAGIAFL